VWCALSLIGTETIDFSQIDPDQCQKSDSESRQHSITTNSQLYDIQRLESTGFDEGDFFAVKFAREQFQDKQVDVHYYAINRAKR